MFDFCQIRPMENIFHGFCAHPVPPRCVTAILLSEAAVAVHDKSNMLRNIPVEPEKGP